MQFIFSSFVVAKEWNGYKSSLVSRSSIAEEKHLKRRRSHVLIEEKNLRPFVISFSLSLRLPCLYHHRRQEWKKMHSQPTHDRSVLMPGLLYPYVCNARPKVLSARINLRTAIAATKWLSVFRVVCRSFQHLWLSFLIWLINFYFSVAFFIDPFAFWRVFVATGHLDPSSFLRDFRTLSTHSATGSL